MLLKEGTSILLINATQWKNVPKYRLTLSLKGCIPNGTSNL